jgi:hypothetical protein
MLQNQVLLDENWGETIPSLDTKKNCLSI